MDCSVSVVVPDSENVNIKLDTDVFDKELVKKIVNGFKIKGKSQSYMLYFQNHGGDITKFHVSVVAGMITHIIKL